MDKYFLIKKTYFNQKEKRQNSNYKQSSFIIKNKSQAKNLTQYQEVKPKDFQDQTYKVNVTNIDVNCWKPRNRECQSMVMIGKQFYSYGGIGSKIYDDLNVFDYEKIQWSEVFQKNNDSRPRYSHSMVEFENKLIVFGGVSRFGNKRGVLNDIREFNLNKNEWTDLDHHNNKVPARFLNAFCLINNLLFIQGGQNIGCQNLDDLHIFNITSQQWTKHIYDSLNLSCHTATLIEKNKQQSILIFGGICQNKLPSDKLYQIKLANFSHERVFTLGKSPSPRMFHQSVFLPDMNIFVVIGGKDQNHQFNTDLHTLDVNNWQWCNITYQGSLEPRAAHFAFYILDEQKIIILGGVDQYGMKKIEAQTVQISIQERPSFIQTQLDKNRSRTSKQRF